MPEVCSANQKVDLNHVTCKSRDSTSSLAMDLIDDHKDEFVEMWEAFT